MESILIAAGAENVRKTLSGLLRPFAPRILHTAATGSEARRMMSENGYTLLIVNAPLPDEPGIELTVQAAAALSGAILLIKAEQYPAAAAEAEPEGVLVLPKPLSRESFERAVRIACGQLSRLSALQNENRRLKDKIEEIRLTDRAKWLLIQFQGLSEPEAHRYIEKRAMDLRVPKSTVAREVIRRYENR